MSNIITPMDGSYTNSPKFEKYDIHDGLSIFRESSKKQVIGYITKHPDGSYIWFMGNTISVEFSTYQEAAEDLAQNYMTYKMNSLAKKLGTINNKELTKF